LNFIDQGTAPGTRQANCEAEGITQPFTSNIVNATSLASQSGNPQLQSESADARTIGVVIRPRWVPRLSVTTDYIDIKLENAIESLSATDIMDACYDATDFPNNESCSRITRDANHQVTFIETGYVNAGFRQFEGIASSIDWTFDLPAFGGEPGSLGSLTFRANHLATMKLVSKVGSASPNQLAGELTLGSTISSKGSLSLDYHKGPFSVYLQGLFTGSTRFDNNDQEDTKDFLRVHRWWLFNSTASYDVSNNFTARLIVNNVFDKQPPFPSLAGTAGNFSTSTSQYFSGILGRSYLLAAEMRF
jgi:iron complex outermembrane recepter protein